MLEAFSQDRTAVAGNLPVLIAFDELQQRFGSSLRGRSSSGDILRQVLAEVFDGGKVVRSAAGRVRAVSEKRVEKSRDILLRLQLPSASTATTTGQATVPLPRNPVESCSQQAMGASLSPVHLRRAPGPGRAGVRLLVTSASVFRSTAEPKFRLVEWGITNQGCLVR